MKERTNRLFVGLCLLFLLGFPSLCFCSGVDGVFWNKMDKKQKSLLIMGYKMGSFDAITTLNSFIALNEQAAKQRKTHNPPRTEELTKISDTYCAERMDITRRHLVRETYIPEEDLDKLVTRLDAFYSQKPSLKIGISEAISKIREEIYERNPSLEKALKARKQERQRDQVPTKR